MSKLIAYITPRVLAWARETAGFEIDEVVTRFKQKSVSSQTILNWEKGDANPSYAQFKKLAKLYKRPLALFFLPEPPEEESLNEELRSLPDSDVKNLPPKMRFMIRQAKIHQLNLIELLEDTPPAHLVRLEALKIQTERRSRVLAAQLAQKTRGILGVSLQQQKDWLSADAALEQWREKIEALGIWVFKDSYEKECENYDGFYLPHQRFPIIHINNNKPKERQIFTLFHELGHFFLSKGGVCFRQNKESEWQSSYRSEEVFCNIFAGEFLVPDESLPLEDMPDGDGIKDIAQRYKVSKEVILRKCLDRGLIDQETYRRRLAAWYKNSSGSRKNIRGGGDYYATKRAYLGNHYLALAFSQFYQKRISETQLADYLGAKVKTLPGLEAELYREKS